MLVGRVAEQAAVQRALDDVRGGRAGVLDIEGEPGIGKSVLLEQCAHEAREHGTAVLFGKCDELGQTRPFGPLLHTGEQSWLGDLIRDREQGLATTRSTRSTRSAPLEAGPEDRAVLVELIVAAVEDRCARAPLVVCIDDLHWADAATVLALRSVARRCADRPLLLAFTRRPHPVPRELAVLVDSLDDIARQRDTAVVHLDLEPLAPDEVAHLAERLTGRSPEPDTLAALSACGGNPLLVVETLTGLAENPTGPVALSQSVQSRMARLEGATRAMAAIASLLGSRFTLSDLGAVMGRTTTALLPLVQELLDARLLVDDGAGLAFRHDLVRQTVAAAIPVSVRADLHQSIGESLRRSGAPAARVAEHLALGTRESWHDSVDVLREAAAEILSKDPSGSTRLLRRALELCPRADPLADEVLAELVDAIAWTGRTEEAKSLAADALTRPLAATVEVRVRSALGRSLLLLGRPHEAIEHEERVLALLVVLDRSAAWAHAECAMCRLFAVDLDGALTEAGAAVTSGRRDADAMAVILALSVQVFAHNTVGDTALATELGTEAVRLADQTPDGEGHRLHPHLFRGIALQTLGDHRAAAASFREGRDRGEALGATWALPIYNFVAALAHWDSGRWDDLLIEVDAGLASCEENGSTIAQVWALAVAGRVHLHRGDLAAAADALDRADDVFATSGLRFGIDWLVLARALWLEAGDRAYEARDLLEVAWDTATGLQATAALAIFGPDLTRLALTGGDTELAERVTARLEQVAAQHPADQVVLGRTWRSRGLLAGDSALLVDAAACFDRLGHPFEAATIRAEAADLHMAARREADAKPLFEEAVATLDRIGARREADRLRSRLEGIGVPVRPARRRALDGWAALTPTENEVVEEVCAGRSNQQVAERLGISRRTVEAHLRSIYTKLSVPTRLALAVAYRDRAATRRVDPGHA